MSLKNLVTTPGIDPWTVRLVAQCLNHYTTPGPIKSKYYAKINVEQEMKAAVSSLIPRFERLCSA
jgi:hypothetical protein